jgi:hypothetical protein
MKLYMQVIRLRFKNINPERPLPNIYNSYRTIFTPLQRVSLHSYDLSWDSHSRPVAVFISFIKYLTFIFSPLLWYKICNKAYQSFGRATPGPETPVR